MRPKSLFKEYCLKSNGLFNKLNKRKHNFTLVCLRNSKNKNKKLQLNNKP